MTTQERINLIDVRDYFSMRNNNQASTLKWKAVRSLNMPNGGTFWQLFSQFNNFDGEFEPSLTQLRQVMEKLKTNLL